MAIDVRPDHRRLVRVLRDPKKLAECTPTELSLLIDVADQTRLLGWLVSELEAQRLPKHAPSWLVDRLATAHALSDEYDRALRWETDRIRRAFAGTDIPWVLLKGAAYLASGLSAGRGRRVADIDVLVPQARLKDAESVLHEWGWTSGEIDAYDDRYYREWMHELPPMVHDERRSIVDLHHAILPRTSRLQPSSNRLLERAVEVAPGIRVLAPAHLVLHAAVHLFHDGEIAGAIRDLVDLDRLFRAFDGQPGFWDDLLAEARALGLARPLYYATRYVVVLFGTPIPSAVHAEIEKMDPPPAMVRGVMDRFVLCTVPVAGRGGSFAAWSLYVRSHWLRMPPGLLARHLTRKALRSVTGPRANV